MLHKEDGQGQDGDKKGKPVPRTPYLKSTARARMVTRRVNQFQKDTLPKEDGQGQDGDKKGKPVPRTCYLKRTARARMVTRRVNQFQGHVT
jgi:hypothetical protein